jgi:hypothetical protein
LETQLNIPWSRSAQDDRCALNSPAKRTQTSGASAIDERVSNPRRQASRFVTGKNLQSNPTASYFVPTFAVSWTAAFLVAAPKLLRGEPLPTLNGILMFPAMRSGRSVVESC